jgi:beta-fructofuranosidase
MKRWVVALFLLSGTVVHAASVDKTLMSWVRIRKADVRGGSVLTLQSGNEFDGIVFAELAEKKWMAGSNFFRRTDRKQDHFPEETASADTLIQMAIVYAGGQVTVYRNGEVHSSHKAKNVDLLGGKGNFAVFGRRHVGGDGSIAGEVDDARIYDRALSAEEIRKLEPNRESAIKPYAWWDFNGDEVQDRMGRYPHSKIIGGAKVAGGKLILIKDSMALAGSDKSIASVSTLTGRPPRRDPRGPYEPETPEWREEPPADWVSYHLAHPGPTHGGPGDPNPAFYYKGRYHLHYIYVSKAGGGCAFGHVSSEDMVHWEWHPTVLVPKTTGHGMFSGTGFFTKEGKPAMVYHGQGSGRNYIAYALDDNMDKWSEPEVMLPVDDDGNPVTTMSYFDPDIWIRDGVYYGLNGVSSGKPPTLMKSNDLKNWKYLGDLLHPDFDEEKLGVKKSEDISCANIFKIGDKWMLICISHKLGCRYFLGDFKDGKYLPDYHERMSHGVRDYFAPETLLTEDGRRVLWTWVFAKTGGLSAIQALPRELQLPEDGKLRIRPLRELESLRYGKERETSVKVKGDGAHNLQNIDGDSLEIEFTCEVPDTKAFGIDVLCNSEYENGTRVVVNPAEKTLKVGSVTAPFEIEEGETLMLRVFVDKIFVEVFANDVQAVFCKDGKWQQGGKVRIFSDGGDLEVDSVTAWKMKSAYRGRALFRKE